MKSITRLLSAAIVAIVALAGCTSTNDSPTVSEQLLPGFFANVEDMSSGATAVYSNVSYMVQVNYTDMTANVQISGLKLPDGTSYPTITLSAMPWKVQDGWKVITGSNVTGAISGMATLPVFNSFEMRIYERVLETSGVGVYSPGVSARFMLGSVYKVFSTYSPQYLFGDTKSTSEEGDVFETKATEYVLTYNTDTRLLSIMMMGARFSENMPKSFDIELRNLPTEVRNGKMYFKVDAITPYIGGTPYDTFPITNLTGSFDPGDDFEFTFTCDPRTMPGKFNVEVDCEFAQTQPLL